MKSAGHSIEQQVASHRVPAPGKRLETAKELAPLALFVSGSLRPRWLAETGQCSDQPPSKQNGKANSQRTVCCMQEAAGLVAPAGSYYLIIIIISHAEKR